MRLYPQLAERRSRQVVRDVLVLLALVLFGVLAWAVRAAVMTLTAISEGFTSSAAGAQDTWGDVGEAMAGIPFVGDDIQRSVQDLAAATFGNAAETGQTVTDAVTMAADVLALVTFVAPAVVLLVLWLPRRLDRARAWDAGYRVLSAVPAPAGSPHLGGAAVAAREGADSPDAIGTPAVDEPSAGQHDTLALPRDPGSGREVAPAADGGRPRLPDAHPGETQVSFPPDELLALRALCHLPFEDLVRFAPRPFEAFAAGDFAPLVAALYAHEGMVPPDWTVPSGSRRTAT